MVVRRLQDGLDAVEPDVLRSAADGIRSGADVEAAAPVAKQASGANKAVDTGRVGCDTKDVPGDGWDARGERLHRRA